MIKNDFEIFSCTECYSDLVCQDSELLCSKCKKVFPLLNSVPDFRPEQYKTAFSDTGKIINKSDEELNHTDVLAANMVFYNEIGDRYEEIPEILRSNKNIRVQQRTREVLEKIAAQYSLNYSLLDMGCGTGFVLDMAKGIFKEAVGLDCAVNMVRVAKDKGHRVCLGDILHTPFASAVFDMVTASGVLHHLYDPSQMFMEAFRILKKGGVLFVDFEPNYYFQRKINPKGLIYRLAEQILYAYRIILRRSASKIDKDKNKKHRKDLKAIEEISEYHHYKMRGLKDEELKHKLDLFGFQNVQIIFHGNCESIYRPRIPFDERLKSIVAQVVSGDLSFFWDRSLKTNACHIAIIARKSKQDKR